MCPNSREILDILDMRREVLSNHKNVCLKINENTLKERQNFGSMAKGARALFLIAHESNIIKSANPGLSS